MVSDEPAPSAGDDALSPGTGPGTGDTLVLTDDPNLPQPPEGTQGARCARWR